MSSSMRNAIQRRSHRERAQPLERKRLGLLEKHKDYQLRAKDWNQKKATLQKLREKAAERNEDEFSFKMLSRQGPGSALLRGSEEKRAKHWDGTALGKRQGKTLSVETLRLLKTQDAGYIRTMRTVAAKEVRQLEERAAIAQSFVGTAGGEEEEDDEDEDDDEEVEKILTKAERKEKRRAKMAGTKIVFTESAEDRDVIMTGDGEEAEDDEKDETQRKAEAAARLQRRLASARKRLQALTAAEDELDLQRARIAKTPISEVATRTGRRTKVRARKR